MKSIPKIIEEQMNRWQITRKKEVPEKEGVSIVTLSREPGSGGRIIAGRLAEKLDVHGRGVEGGGVVDRLVDVGGEPGEVGVVDGDVHGAEEEHGHPLLGDAVEPDGG